MTIINWIQIGLWIVVLICGTFVKKYTGRKVKSLEGTRGLVTKKDEVGGELFGQFGE